MLQNYDFTLFLMSSHLLFFGGIIIVLLKRNLLFMLLGIEMMFCAVNLNFIFFYHIHPHSAVIVLILCILSVAICETAILFVVLFKVYKTYQEILLNNIIEHNKMEYCFFNEKI